MSANSASRLGCTKRWGDASCASSQDRAAANCQAIAAGGQVMRDEVLRVVPRQQGKHRLPFVLDPRPENRGHRSLAVEIDDQHPLTDSGEGGAQIYRRGRLSDPTLLVDDSDCAHGFPPCYSSSAVP